MNLKRFIAELKRRNVFRVAIAYVIASWLIIQVVTVIEEPLAMPGWFDTVVIVMIGIGLPICLIIAWAFELTPEGLKTTKEVDLSDSITHNTGKKLNYIIIGVLSFALLFTLVERFFFAKTTILESEGLVAETASIAVLPFVNMSSDVENEYFSDGLSEELLNALAQVEDMRVAGRTSSFKFKGHNEDLKIIGEELGVQHILEGSVRKAGNQVRITAQLINVNNGYHMWSATYDRELEDIFAIQEEISRKVLNELKVRLLPDDEEELANVPTTDIEAYQAYLKGNQMMVNRDYDEIEAAIELYQTAIRLDPSFAEAHAKLALAYNVQGYYGNVPFEQMQADIKTYVDRALALDDQSASAYAALGSYYENELELDKALSNYLKSNELNPNLIDNYNWIGNLYERMGQEEKQLEWYRKGYEIDPLNPHSIYNMIRLHWSEENYEEMDRFIEKNMRVNPEFTFTYFLKGFVLSQPPFEKMDEAFINLLKTHQLDPESPRAIRIMTNLSLLLDIEPLADHYYQILKSDYNESFEYLMITSGYGSYKQDYTDFKGQTLAMVDKLEMVPNEAGLYWSLYDYALATGDTDRALSYFRKYDAGLFSDTLSTLTGQNRDIVAALALTLKRAGDQKINQRLIPLLCPDNPMDKTEGEQDFDELSEQAECAFLKGEVQRHSALLHQILETHGQLRFLDTILTEVEKYHPEFYTDESKEDHEQVKAKLRKMRDNVIAYYKAQGEWKEEWEDAK